MVLKNAFNYHLNHMNNISTIINNKEFDELISEASEYQIKIIDELKPQLKELKGRFIQQLY